MPERWFRRRKTMDWFLQLLWEEEGCKEFLTLIVGGFFTALILDLYQRCTHRE
jgi:hypothetical protein